MIEIMVAVALLAVIIVGLLAMFYQVQRAFRAGTAQVDVMEGGRAVMNLLVRDLQEMAAMDVRLVTNCVVLPAQGTAPWPPSSTQEQPGGPPRENFQEDICLMSRANDEWVATSYRMAFAGSGAGTLYRMTIRTNIDTLPDIAEQSATNLSNVICTDVDFDGLDLHRVLDGVVHLTFTPCDRNGYAYKNSNVYANNDPTDSSAYADNVRVDHNKGVYAFVGNGLPAYIDIELAVLETGAFEKFKARSEQDYARGTNYLGNQIGRTHVFRQRVAVRPSATDTGARFDVASP